MPNAMPWWVAALCVWAAVFAVAGAAAVWVADGGRRAVLARLAHRPEAAAALALGARLRAWRYDRLRTRPDPDAPRLRRIEVRVDDPAAARPAWDAMRAVLTPDQQQAFDANVARLQERMRERMRQGGGPGGPRR